MVKKVSMWDLQQRQKLPLKNKITIAQDRIKEWAKYYNNNFYISFSGGKDSTVLLDIARKLYPNCPAVFCDTGLEFPEIRDFVKTCNNITWIKPELNYQKIILKYGYPVISKEQSYYLYQYRTVKTDHMKNKRLNGDKNGNFKISEKWKFLIDAPFKISDRCCTYLKKKPMIKYEKETSQKAIVGTLAGESRFRTMSYLKTGCNSFDENRPVSKPLSVWTNKDIWEYIKVTNLKYSKIYDMGYERTGCMFCMFGLHMGKDKENRFQVMKKTHPKQYNFCIDKLGCGKVLDFCGILF